MHLNSQLIFERYGAPVIRPGDRVLEVGPDRKPSSYRQAVTADVTWETAELGDQAGRWTFTDDPPDHVMASEYAVPVADGTFDVVLSGQVAEHVRELWTWMTELARVTKPGGRVVTISPVSWEYHEAPHDCWRVYPEGMRAVCGYAGLTVETAWWGTLEPKPSRRTFPGNGADEWNPRTGWRAKAKSMIGWPVAVSYDLVTIAAKP